MNTNVKFIENLAFDQIKAMTIATMRRGMK